MVEGTDSFSNIIGSVYYPDGETAKDLALELVENVWPISIHIVSFDYACYQASSSNLIKLLNMIAFTLLNC